jgi:hypothetical protein
VVVNGLDHEWKEDRRGKRTARKGEFSSNSRSVFSCVSIAKPVCSSEAPETQKQWHKLDCSGKFVNWTVAQLTKVSNLKNSSFLYYFHDTRLTPCIKIPILFLARDVGPGPMIA